MGTSPIEVRMVETADMSYAAWQERVRGTNVSTVTLLATDYLNHFNEAIMLLGMVPDMPEVIADCRAWRPKSYEAHFRDSSFSERDLIIAAYAHAPLRYRIPFERTIDEINAAITKWIARMDAVQATGDPAALAREGAAATLELQALVAKASAIIHGAGETVVVDQSAVDAIIAGGGSP